jgi:hypothetical protein
MTRFDWRLVQAMRLAAAAGFVLLIVEVMWLLAPERLP